MTESSGKCTAKWEGYDSPHKVSSNLQAFLASHIMNSQFHAKAIVQFHGIYAESKDQKADFPTWSKGLDNVLGDPHGIIVFESFLQTEGRLQYLEFLWACEGMKNLGLQQASLVPKLIHCIYSHYIINGVLSNSATEPILNTLRDAMEDEHQLSCSEMIDTLNELKALVALYLRNELYPKFLASEVFLKAVQEFHESSSKDGQTNYVPATQLSGYHLHKNKSESGMDESIENGQSCYRKKIIFVLNNDDLPTHHTLVPAFGNSGQNANDLDNFTKELTEKLQLLKLEQERDEANARKIKVAIEMERSAQVLFCSKLKEALQDHLEKEIIANTSSKCGVSNSDTNVLEPAPQAKDKPAKKFGFSCRKSRFKSCLQNLSMLTKKTGKVRAKLQKCGNYSMSCMKQRERPQNLIGLAVSSNQMTKSRSLDFSDCEFPDDTVKHCCKESQKELPCSSSCPSSMNKIQNWTDATEVDSINDTEATMN